MNKALITFLFHQPFYCSVEFCCADLMYINTYLENLSVQISHVTTWTFEAYSPGWLIYVKNIYFPLNLVDPAYIQVRFSPEVTAYVIWSHCSDPYK